MQAAAIRLPPGVDPNAIDPNVVTVIAAHHQQHQDDLQAAQQQNQDARQNRDEQRKIDQEIERIGRCDGTTQNSVREWLQEMDAALPYFAQARRDRVCQEITKGTARGPLRRTYDQFMAQQANHAHVTHQAITAHLANSFLGADEQATLRDELKLVIQGKKELVPAYGRRYIWKASYAYPVALRNAEQEREMADTFMAGLRPGKIQDACFDANPPLITLQAAVNHAEGEYERKKR